jgi:hypothetical protein
MTQSTPDPAPKETFEARMDRFGKDAQAAGERIGREAEAAGKRLAADPVVADAALSLTRLWGLLVLAVGVWFFADVTLGMDMPAVAWGDIWPVAIILVGLVVIVRGLGRRRA